MSQKELELHEKHRKKVGKGIARYLLVCSIVTIIHPSFGFGVLTHSFTG